LRQPSVRLIRLIRLRHDLPMTLTLPGSAHRQMTRAAVVAATALVVGSLSAAPASAATTLGSTEFAAPGGPCPGDSTWVQGLPPAGASYEATSPGVITQWRFRSADETQLELKVLRYDGSNLTFTVKASSDVATAQAGVTTTFGTRLPIGIGDVLGLTPKSGKCVEALTPGASVYVVGGDLATGSSAAFTYMPGTALPVAAIVEPDADGDGYGDETQDACPQQAATQGACVTTPPPGSTAPDTKVTKGPTQTKKSKVTYAFSSTDSAATFECRLTGKNVKTVQQKTYQPCTSPKKYKKLLPGRYKFFARAVDAAGHVDATPAKVKLVVKPR
jgi:hypothetical protein